MPCEYCHQYGTHHPRCPLYEPPKSTHYCSICGDGILNGEEYIENDDSEYAHWDCFYNTRNLVEWLGFKVKTMYDEE